jgi:GNAT superfamily N-acetyltransferase
MSRSPVQLRAVRQEDAEALKEIWSSLSVRGKSAEDVLLGIKASIARTDEHPGERIVVAEIDGAVVGACHLQIGELTPLSGEQCVRLSHLATVETKQADPVARALVDAAVTWAEDEGVSHVIATTASGNREANRFMARLGLAQVAVTRVASTATLRGKLPTEKSAVGGRPANQKLDKVLAARRSLRRQRPAG